MRYDLIKYEQASTDLTAKEKIGQLFMPAAFVNDSEEEIVSLEELIATHYIGGICFFHSRASAATNFEGKKKVIKNENSYDTLKLLIKRYQKAAKHPLLIAIDAEWGLAMRIENTPQYPYAITLGALPKNEGHLIFEVGKNIAKDCKSAGIHWNLSPVVDVNNNPNNPVIGYRSFGEDRNLVTGKALQFIKGTQSEGVLTSIKHFPGHGDTATDSHLGLPLINKSRKELDKNELFPFKEIIDQGIDSVMVGHLSVPALSDGKETPSSISKEIIKGVLRSELGFEGVVISDALNMHAVAKNYPEKGELEWLAFDAGNDILCFAEHTKEGISKILENALPDQIEESFERVWRLKEKAFEGGNEVTTLTQPDSLNRRISEKCITLQKGTSSNLAEFTKSEFTAISNIEPSKTIFFKHLRDQLEFDVETLPNADTFRNKNLLVALFPPQVKPNNLFGFNPEDLKILNRLLAVNKVTLYLFGNPYMLNHIEYSQAETVVLAYQNFEVFQKTASNHFLGRVESSGKLSVKTNLI
ncbi:MAG: glycoside hydrolase [Pseudozobellia sp.]|nr:glycoside hydrolase [Pseudozobellia sp.]MBG50420.1 glycoside hydrolase [Pseudozobellia sp.]|tara:strand:+ start:183104 stop:184687 length:1584 start_codon:yes stop_codon:yes gene_type:complete